MGKKEKTEEKSGRPSREEQLAAMTPEARKLYKDRMKDHEAEEAMHNRNREAVKLNKDYHDKELKKAVKKRKENEKEIAKKAG